MLFDVNVPLAGGVRETFPLRDDRKLRRSDHICTEFWMFLFHALSLSLTLKSVARGEWDVWRSSSVENTPEALFSFEFHNSRSTPGGLVSTVWVSSPTAPIAGTVDNGKLAEIEIAFVEKNAGKFTIDGRSYDFAFADEDNKLSATIVVRGVEFRFRILSDTRVEIRVGDESYVAAFQIPRRAAKAVLGPRRRGPRGIIETIGLYIEDQLHKGCLFLGIPREYQEYFVSGVLIFLIQVCGWWIWRVVKFVWSSVPDQAPARVIEKREEKNSDGEEEEEKVKEKED